MARGKQAASTPCLKCTFRTVTKTSRKEIQETAPPLVCQKPSSLSPYQYKNHPYLYSQIGYFVFAASFNEEFSKMGWALLSRSMRRKEMFSSLLARVVSGQRFHYVC